MASASLSYELFPRSVLTSSSLRRISSSDGDAVLIGSLDDIQREFKKKQGVGPGAETAEVTQRRFKNQTARK